MDKGNKKVAGAETPCGNYVKHLFSNNNIGNGKEQLKIQKLMWLFELCLQINGLEQRKQSVTGCKPTVFFDFSGHTVGIRIGICTEGWIANVPPDMAMQLYLDNENFSDKCKEVFNVLIDIRNGLEQGG